MPFDASFDKRPTSVPTLANAQLAGTIGHPGGHRPTSYTFSVKGFLPLIVVGVALLLSLLGSDWIPGLSIMILWGAWKYLSREPGPPVIAAAFTHQWLQVTIAVLYSAVTGRTITQMEQVDYRPMMLIGLCSLVSLFAGFYFAAGWRRTAARSERRNGLPIALKTLAVAYAISLMAASVMQSFAWDHPQLTQVVLALSLVRYIVLFLLVRGLATPRLRLGWILTILAGEVAIGFTGFFADFREPLVVIGLSLLGAVDRGRLRTWLLVGLVAVVAVVAGILWTTIKPAIRENFDYAEAGATRLRNAAQAADASLSSPAVKWAFHTDTTVARVWALYYPALAVARVPAVLPHENGDLLLQVVEHVLAPRFLFPDKPDLPSTSDKVRKYAGVWVSGRETKTSFAFGYAAESYVDFGVPLMFLPIFVFGLFAGLGYRLLARAIVTFELRSAALTVLFWSSLSLFEVSWVMMVGLGVTQAVVLVTVLVSAERFLLNRNLDASSALVRA